MKTWGLAALMCSVATMSLPANAVPIELSFSGTVGSTFSYPSAPSGYEDSVGHAFTATFVIDSAGLQRGTESTDKYEQINFEGPSPQGISGSLSIDGLNIDLHPYANNSGGIYFEDTKGLIDYGNGIAAGEPDQFYISLFSTSFPAVWPTDGSFVSRGLHFSTVDWGDYPQGGSLLSDFIDFSRDTYDPEILLTHPFAPNTSLTFYGNEMTCENSLCVSTSGFSVDLDFDTVTRRVVSVPEPTTLWLMSFGLLGTAMARRRKKASSVASV